MLLVDGRHLLHARMATTVHAPVSPSMEQKMVCACTAQVPSAICNMQLGRQSAHADFASSATVIKG